MYTNEGGSRLGYSTVAQLHMGGSKKCLSVCLTIQLEMNIINVLSLALLKTSHHEEVGNAYIK